MDIFCLLFESFICWREISSCSADSPQLNDMKSSTIERRTISMKGSFQLENQTAPLLSVEDFVECYMPEKFDEIPLVVHIKNRESNKYFHHSSRTLSTFVNVSFLTHPCISYIDSVILLHSSLSLKLNSST